MTLVSNGIVSISTTIKTRSEGMWVMYLQFRQFRDQWVWAC